MQTHEALEIVRRLVDGLHPETGEATSETSLYRSSKTVGALNRAAIALEFEEQRERVRKSLPANAGKGWSDAEDAQICDELRGGINFQQIASIHGRTAGSIVARLIRLGKISATKPASKSA
jgi:hypothetical protein